MSDEEAVRLWETFLDGANPRAFAAFDRLYAAFLPTVIRYCNSRLRDVHLAEDVAHAVFVRLLEARPVLESSFIGLLFRIARSTCAAEFAKQTSQQPLPVEPPDRSESDPGYELEQRDTRAALADCLDRLPERDRTLVALRHGEGLTYRQIREVLRSIRDASSTFTRRLRRIKDQLLRCLKEKIIF